MALMWCVTLLDMSGCPGTLSISALMGHSDITEICLIKHNSGCGCAIRH